MTTSLPRDWFARDALEVATGLLGASIETRRAEGTVSLRITEVEAYRGAADPGSHAFRGQTARNAAMFGEPGHLYVYRHLGLHTCANVVCGPAGLASGVLLRAGEVIDGVTLARARRQRAGVLRSDVDLARGPARLTVALGIDLTAGGLDITDPRGAVVVTAATGRQDAVIATGPRVGVSGAGGDGALFPWRFWLVDEPTVSAYRAASRRVRRLGGGAEPRADRAAVPERRAEHGRLAPRRRSGAAGSSEGDLRE